MRKKLRMIEEVFSSWKKAKWSFLSTLLVMSFSLTIVVAVINLTVNLDNILTNWGDGAELTIYLEDELNESRVSEIEKDLKSLSGLEEPRFVSKKEAAMDFKKEMLSYSSDLANADDLEAAVPASFRMRLILDRDYKTLEESAKTIQSWSGVEEVSFGQQWVERYKVLVSGAKRSGWMVNLAILLSTIFVVANAIRSSLNLKRDEIAIMELVGATPSMIRAPFIAEGALLGFLSGLIALTVGNLIVLAQREVASGVMDYWNLSSHIGFLSLFQQISVLVLATSVGAVSSLICVTRMNNGWLAARGSD